MSTYIQATLETVNARLSLDVTYLPNGDKVAFGEGLLTGEITVEVDNWSIDVPEVPSATGRETLEAEIAAFMQQSIGDGNLGAEDIPVRLPRYRLMVSVAFADEMRGRMGVADDAHSSQAAIALTGTDDGREIEMQVAVACANASAIPDMPIFKARNTGRNTTWGATMTRPRTWPKKPSMTAARLIRRLIGEVPCLFIGRLGSFFPKTLCRESA